MPASAYVLASLFVVISIAAGALAWWLIGPRRPLALPIPILAAFAVLYLAGHRFGWQIGPTIELLAFHVALPFDIALAAAGGGIGAVIQRSMLALLTGQSRRRSS